jgi:hypothetical protein
MLKRAFEADAALARTTIQVLCKASVARYFYAVNNPIPLEHGQTLVGDTGTVTTIGTATVPHLSGGVKGAAGPAMMMLNVTLWDELLYILTVNVSQHARIDLQVSFWLHEHACMAAYCVERNLACLRADHSCRMSRSGNVPPDRCCRTLPYITSF